MKQLQREEKQIRKQLEEAYKQKDREKVMEAAKQLSLLAMRVIQRWIALWPVYNLIPGKKYGILNMKKGKPETHGLPYNDWIKSLMRLAVTIGGSGGLFFVLKDLVNKTNKCNNEDTYLNKIRIV